jgi:serine/threonine-protein kinase RsbW
VEIKFTLQLPRDALSVPVVRRVLKTSMLNLGVDETCVTDIEVALTEACTNVLDHAAAGEDYEVVAGVDETRCVIEVVDAGRGFDADPLGHAEADLAAEEGRGIQLIRALMDRVHFRARPDSGTIVRLEKHLVYTEESPIVRLADRSQSEADHDLSRSEETLHEGNAALAEVAEGTLPRV